MLRILHTIDTTGPGGAESVFINLTRLIDREKYDLKAVVGGMGWVYNQLINNGLDPIIIPAKGSFRFLYLYKLIYIIKKYRIGLIHSHLFGSNVYCSLAGMICNIPVISTFHGYVDASSQDKLLNLKFRIINGGSSRIIFVSEHLKRHFAQTTHVSMRKSEVIYNGVDFITFGSQKNSNIRDELGLDKDHILLVSIGNIRKAKGYDILIRAAALVISKRPECKFIIAGDQSGDLYPQLLDLVNSLVLDRSIYFLGFREDVKELLKNSNIFVLSSTSEGLSIATLEAMSCGIPVVVTKCGGPEEIVEQGVNGVLVNTGDYHSLADGILCMLENEQLRKSCIRGARELITRKFSLNTMVMQYEECYRECAKKDR